MNGQLFRKKSLDKVSSPEQLNDYIRVSNPSVWMVLTAVIVFLAGVCVWGIFGHLDTVVKTAGECSGGVVACYVKESDISALQTGMEITVDGKQGTVTDGKYDCYYDASYENAAVCVKCGSDRLKKNGVEFFWMAPLPYPYAYSVVTQCEECGYAWRYCSDSAVSGEMYDKGYVIKNMRYE